MNGFILENKKYYFSAFLNSPYRTKKYFMHALLRITMSSKLKVCIVYTPQIIIYYYYIVYI